MRLASLGGLVVVYFWLSVALPGNSRKRATEVLNLLLRGRMQPPRSWWTRTFARSSPPLGPTSPLQTANRQAVVCRKNAFSPPVSDFTRKIFR